MSLRAQPLDLGQIKRVRNRVASIGVELEGGWHKLPKGVQLTHDGSIHLETSLTPREQATLREWGTRPPSFPRHVGEIPSPILSLDNLASWVRQHYPDLVNETCGMHVHLGFRTALTYQRLMDERFVATVVAKVSEWATEEKLDKSHPIWRRLRGEDNACELSYWADQQAIRTNKDMRRDVVGSRYTAVNYCYTRNGTLEVRLLPMMSSAELAVRAITHLVGVVNASIIKLGGREKPINIEVPPAADGGWDEIIQVEV